jgi:hypothetical protein
MPDEGHRLDHGRDHPAWRGGEPTAGERDGDQEQSGEAREAGRKEKHLLTYTIDAA